MMEEEDASSGGDDDDDSDGDADGYGRAPGSVACSLASSAGRSISLGGGGGGRDVHRGGGWGVRSASSSIGAAVHTLASHQQPGSASLAESVFDGVRSKMRRLQEEVRVKDGAIVGLRKVRRSGAL
jgi:hypothetical protein